MTILTIKCYFSATPNQQGYRFQPVSLGLTKNDGDCDRFLQEMRRTFFNQKSGDDLWKRQLEYFECTTRSQNKIKKRLKDKQKQLNRIIQMIRPRHS